jgi:hypothetical protein
VSSAETRYASALGSRPRLAASACIWATPAGRDTAAQDMTAAGSARACGGGEGSPWLRRARASRCRPRRVRERTCALHDSFEVASQAKAAAEVEGSVKHSKAWRSFWNAGSLSTGRVMYIPKVSLVCWLRDIACSNAEEEQVNRSDEGAITFAVRNGVARRNAYLGWAFTEVEDDSFFLLRFFGNSAGRCFFLS